MIIAGASSTTATISKGLPIIHVWCPVCEGEESHVVKAKETKHVQKGYPATTKYQIYCKKGGKTLERRRCTRNLSSLKIAEPAEHGCDRESVKACSVCKSGGY
jgi:hypothetical protein